MFLCTLSAWEEGVYDIAAVVFDTPKRYVLIFDYDALFSWCFYYATINI
jgi:hypothetical protein